jgi:hypothetical protein
LTTMTAQTIFLVVLGLVAQALSLSSPVTITVCTGVDCRVDGASECLRQLHKNVPSSDRLKVTGRPCMGPCGDGPCVRVLDPNSKAIVVDQEDRVQTSLAPPELFGSNPRGIYQVRTVKNLQQVISIATDAAGLEPKNDGGIENILATEWMISSTRKPYDRPRNERKVLQRLAQCMVVTGLYEYYQSNNALGSLQYEVAFLLLLVSNFIMKENFATFLSKKITK